MLNLLRGPVAVGLCLLASAAIAQSPDAPLKGRDAAPNLPPQSQTVPEKVRPSEGVQPGDKGTLSEKLEKSDGVIAPPGNAAPGMVVTPPETGGGGMPVIKPGDLPGNRDGVEAK